MNKLAIFVEGQTEQIFIERLVTEIAGENNVRIEKRKVTGGSTCKRRMKLVEAMKVDSGQKYYVLIVDCGSDDSVKSRICEEYDTLSRAGYEFVLGVRDVFPIPRADIGRLLANLPLRVKTKPISVQFVLAIMEIEAWFLAESEHFVRIDSRLTNAYIHANVGFDPSSENMEQRDEPARDLKAIYNLVGKTYSKNKAVVERTAGVLDYARFYLELPDKYPPLKLLVDSLDKFLK